MKDIERDKLDVKIDMIEDSDKDKLSFKKIISMILGIVFMVIAIIGVVVPILPTTGFLLLSSYFFMRSSEKINLWFRNTKIFKNHLESFEKDRSMTLKTKVRILLFASIMLMIPIIKVDILAVRLFIVVLLTWKYYYFIFKINTIKDKERDGVNI